MNWTMELIEPLETVWVTTSGNFDVDEDFELVKEIVSQKYWKPGMNMLLDHRKVEFSGTDIPMIKKVSEHHQMYAEEIGGGKMALLMNTLSDYARGRQFEMLTDHKMAAKISIFMDETKAFDWLASDDKKTLQKPVYVEF